MARKLLGIVITDIPRSWNSLWIAGKIHERLQEYRLALDCFERGLAANPSQPDLAIEASLAAVYLGAGLEAEKYAKVAVAARPTDPGHRADMALALLVAGKPQEAQLAVEEALKLAPDDNVTKALHCLISVIIQKSLHCPKDMAGLQKLAKTQGISNVLQRTPG
jgi:tetratricopeptide (TPR) repeat protein